MTKQITTDEAQMAIEAIRGDERVPTYATDHPREGDVALILRKEGGMEVLSVMYDNPSDVNVHSLGLRGLFAIALFCVSRNPEIMQAAMEEANEVMEEYQGLKRPN